MKKIVKKLIDKQTMIFIIGGLIINALCFFIYALPVKASGGDNVESPYFPMIQNENNHFNTNCINAINNYFDDENYYCVMRFIRFADYGWGQELTWFWVYSIPKEEGGISVFAEINSNGYQFSLYEISSQYNATINQYCWDNYAQHMSVTQSGTLYDFSAIDSSVYNNGCDYLSNFSLYTNNTANRLVVLSYGNDDDFPTIQYGHATPPDEFDNPITSNNQTLPREVPQAPTYNSYTWNTYNPPPFDNSSVLNAIESLGDKLEYAFNYLKDGINGEIYTLNGNIKAYFEYIGETIQYYGGLIIDNIQNLITTFYNNMVSLVEDIAGKITEFKETLTAIYDFIVHPLDTSALNTQLNNSTFVSAVRTTKTQITTFNNMFSNISQPENVVFTIDLSGLWFDGGVSYLDFSILSPVLPFIRLVLGCMLLYDFIVTIFTNINSYIGGNSAKNDGG